MANTKIRQPIVTVVGHVDQGKTSILDFFRGTCVHEGEAGGITQKISYTNFPLAQISKICPIFKNKNIDLEIPGFLFIDTPGHAAFTNLRKRGGSLADLAILVVSAKEGIKPQTAEVLQILRTYKTPFLIAFNKIDGISGWRANLGKDLKESIEKQALNVSEEFNEAFLTFQASLCAHGFDSDLYFNIDDFTKRIAVVPCSAKTGEGISELLFVLCGLCQKFLKERLKVSDDAKGIILEVKKEKGRDYVESVLYDGTLKIGDEIAVASFSEPIISKVRSIEEIEPLCFKYKNVQKISAAAGARLHLTNKEEILSGMPFQVLKGNIEKIKEDFKKEISKAVELDKTGIIVKTDSLGSLDAFISLLRNAGIKIVRAGIGNINKCDFVSAKANLEINPLDAVIAGFNVGVDEEFDAGDVKILTGDVVYKLIDDLDEWRKQKQSSMERERMLGLATICKLEILKQHIFRNSNPAIFGVKILAGKLKVGVPIMDDKGEHAARVKGMQIDKDSVNRAEEGRELAVSLPGINFERRLADSKFLYAEIGEKQFREFKKNKDLLSAGELKVLQEIVDIMRRKDENWGR